LIIPFPAFERDSDTITLSSNQNTSLHFTSLLSLSDVHFHLIRVSFHGFRFLDFHAHVVLFTPLSFAIWFVSLTFTKFNSPFFLFFSRNILFLLLVFLVLQICTWRRVKGAMISGRSFCALSAPRITTSFPSVATLTTTTLSKPKTGFVPFSTN